MEGGVATVVCNTCAPTIDDISGRSHINFTHDSTQGVAIEVSKLRVNDGSTIESEVWVFCQFALQ